MSDNLTSVLLAFCVVLGPIWLLAHYGTKWRISRRANAEDAASYAQLAEVAERMERRMAVLERILDAEVPNWRQNANLGGEYRGTI